MPSRISNRFTKAIASVLSAQKPADLLSKIGATIGVINRDRNVTKVLQAAKSASIYVMLLSSLFLDDDISSEVTNGEPSDTETSNVKEILIP